MAATVPLSVARRSSISSEQKVAFLKKPSSYPEATDQVEMVETHMAWVFLTDTQAYKLKKPVQYGSLDLTTRSARRRNSVMEVQLNRRLAGETYQGVVRLAYHDGALTLDGPGRATDWLVKMHRLPADRMIDALAQRGDLRPSHLRKTASRLTELYRSLPPALANPRTYRDRLLRCIEHNAQALRQAPYPLPPAQIDATSEALTHFVHHARATLEARVLDGHIIEGHGDLRPEHVCMCPDPIIFDCLEFNRTLRVLDAADEIAFLAMECERLGVDFATPTLLEAYATHTGEAVTRELVHFYQAMRALQRARLAVRHTWPTRDPERAQHWQSQAESYLQRAEADLRAM